MSQFTPGSKRKLVVIGMITLFMLTVVVVLEQKKQNINLDDNALVISGVINQHHLRWHYYH